MAHSGNDPKRRILDDERAQIASARFESIRNTGTLTPLATLAKRFRRNEAVISRILASALRSGLVEVRVLREDDRLPERLWELERELLRKYRGLLSAIVVGVGDPPLSAPDSEPFLAYSDKVHRSIGLALAGEIARGTLIKNGDQIGIGPGRGVYETVKALQRQPPMRAAGVTLVSLSGIGYLRHHARNRNLLLDPDFMVVFLGEAFEKPVSLELVSSPIVPEQERAMPARHWLALDDRNRRPIDTAFLGVGVLIPGNRFYQEASGQVSTQEPVYGPVRESLRALLRAAEPFITPEYVPVGDLGYHLFFIDPPREKTIPEDARSVMIRQIDSINNRLVSAHARDFKEMRTVVLIAGTSPKARAIHQLMSGDLASVAHLCTDSFTAHSLLTY